MICLFLINYKPEIKTNFRSSNEKNAIEAYILQHFSQAFWGVSHKRLAPVFTPIVTL